MEHGNVNVIDCDNIASSEPLHAIRLEEITVGASVIGIGNKPVSIIAVKWFGSSVLEIAYKDSMGQLANELLYREDESRLYIADRSLA